MTIELDLESRLLSEAVMITVTATPKPEPRAGLPVRWTERGPGASESRSACPSHSSRSNTSILPLSEGRHSFRAPAVL